MKRIGQVASKIAKGNLVFYNLSVLIIAALFSLLIFIICGSTIIMALLIMSYVFKGVLPPEFESEWYSVMKLCLVALTVIVGMFNLYAISLNVKIKKENI